MKESTENLIVTPGDWVVRPFDDSQVVVVSEQTEKCKPLVAVCTGPERHANARRIAAVNDLYDAAHQLICATCGNRVGWKGAYDQEQRRLDRQDWRKCPGCRAIRLAMTKADGSRAVVRTEHD